MALFIWILTLTLVAASFRKDAAKTQQALRNSVKALKGLSRGTFLMVVVFGLILAIVSKERLLVLFSYQGLLGFVVVSVVGAIITIPGPIAFPIAGSLLKLGASKAILASFITTLTMVGIVSAPFEASFFGRRFTVLRQSLSFIVAIIIGVVMGEVL